MTEITDEQLQEVVDIRSKDGSYTLVTSTDGIPMETVIFTAWLAEQYLQSRKDNAALKQAGLTMGEIIDRKNEQIVALAEKLRLTEEEKDGMTILDIPVIPSICMPSDTILVSSKVWKDGKYQTIFEAIKISNSSAISTGKG